MNKFPAVLYDTFLEIKSGKIIYLYAIITGIILLVLALSPSFTIDGQDIISDGIAPANMVQSASAYFYKGFIEFYVLFLLFGTAWLMPRYLEKGRIEIALSKPIARPVLALFKFISIFMMASVILTLGTIPVWIVMSLRISSFSTGFFGGLLYGMLDYLLIFGLMFSIGIITRSGAISVIAYFGLKIAASLLDKREAIYPLIRDSIWKPVLDSFYHILPKYSGISDNYLGILSNWEIERYYPIWSTAIFVFVLLGISLYYFQRRDY